METFFRRNFKWWFGKQLPPPKWKPINLYECWFGSRHQQDLKTENHVQHHKKNWFNGGNETFNDQLIALGEKRLQRVDPDNWNIFAEVHNRKSAIDHVILFDQVPRRLYWDERRIKYDHLALQIAEAYSTGYDDITNSYELIWLQHPILRQEDPRKIYELIEKRDKLWWELRAKGFKPTCNLIEEINQMAKQHIKVLEQFGRYPEYNEYRGLKSTVDELEYLVHKEHKLDL